MGDDGRRMMDGLMYGLVDLGWMYDGGLLDGSWWMMCGWLMMDV